jgi:hypothetical protein
MSGKECSGLFWTRHVSNKTVWIVSTNDLVTNFETYQTDNAGFHCMNSFVFANKKKEFWNLLTVSSTRYEQPQHDEFYFTSWKENFGKLQAVFRISWMTNLFTAQSVVNNNNVLVGLALAKAAALRININIDGAPIASKSYTHPSHSQTSRLLTSSLSLGVPVPRPTQCVRGV